MRRLLAMILVLVMLLSLSAAALAAPPGHDRHHPGPGDRRDGGHDRNFQRDHDSGPLKWREPRQSFDGHNMRRIHDRNLEHRYPGLRGYKWQGHGDGHRGFWHNDHYVNDGIIFFDRDDRMAGFGYMANDTFIFVDEHGYREDHDLMFFMLLFKMLQSMD